MTQPLFSVSGLRVELPDAKRKSLFGRRPMVEILHGLDFEIQEGSVLGIVGESGSGKSTLGRALVRLLEPTAGTIRFANRDISHLDEVALRPLRRDLQVIFQDPLSSLNPRLTVATIVGRPLLFQGSADNARTAREMAAAALATVGLPKAFATALPARAFRRPAPARGDRSRDCLETPVRARRRDRVGPRRLVEGEILSLLEKLRSELGLTVAFISHDLSVVRRLCDRVVVMRRGAILENRPTGALFAAPEHPYTRGTESRDPSPGRGRPVLARGTLNPRRANSLVQDCSSPPVCLDIKEYIAASGRDG